MRMPGRHCAYRHRRPALRVARSQLINDFPGEYAHRLRDINNREEVSEEELIESFQMARSRLVQEIASNVVEQ